METIDRERLRRAFREEERQFEALHPRSHTLHSEALHHMPGGAPMMWMSRWSALFPLFVERGDGAHLADVDGIQYLDLCLGDTGAMTGHAPAAVLDAVAKRIRLGTTFMLPTEDGLAVSQELARRFGLPFWQMTLTATDANRFAIRIARHITGRRKILVFNWCYHGTVDETFATLRNGQVDFREGNIGPPVHPSETTRVVEFNDVEGLERELADRQVACILAEPAMTNIGIVHPLPGFHEAMRRIATDTGALLVLDETHTISAGPAGCTGAWGLQPDIMTLGKPIASGIPAAVYGLSDAVAAAFHPMVRRDLADTGGIGGTLAGNALSLAAMRVTLEQVLTVEAFDRMIAMAERFEAGVAGIIREFALPWTVSRLGCRVEYWFGETPPKNGTEAATTTDLELDQYMHLFALNRGILMTPFHSMALMAPATTAEDIDFHTKVFREAVVSLFG